MKGIFLLILVVLLNACSSNSLNSSNYSIIYATYPEGAKVFCKDVYYGVTPLKLSYELSKENGKNKILNHVDCTAVWSSGAKGTFGLVDSVSLSESPDGVFITANRDTFDGFEHDRNVAINYSSQRKAQRQQEHQSSMAVLNVLSQSLQSITNSYNPSSSNSNNKKSNVLYDASGCTGIVVNGSCTGYVKPNTPKYKCHGTVLQDGSCSGTMQRVY